MWWESNLKGLFPVGEVNGTHGVRRPGGAALNAGQVGSFRAALFIAANYGEPPPDVQDFMQSTRSQIKSRLAFSKRAIRKGPGKGVTPKAAVRDIQERMSACGAAVRDPAKVKEAVAEVWKVHQKVVKHLQVSSPAALTTAFRTLDLCLTHAVYLEALQEYLKKGGFSRGSFLVLHREGIAPSPGLGKEWRFQLNDSDDFVNHKILEVRVGRDLDVEKRWVDIRPIPDEDLWFETVWNDYVNNRMIRKEDPDE